MTLLAIDSSSRHRLLCGLVAADGTVIDGEAIDGGRVSETLLPVISRMLATGVDAVDAVVVVTGPGSFTGLRAGMAVGLGVAHALDLPLHGVGALTVVAAAAGEPLCVEAVSDAGRGFLYTAVVARQAGGGCRVVTGPGRVHRDAWRRGADPVVTFDNLGLPPVTRCQNPLAALARAAVFAVTRPALARGGLAPNYGDEAAAVLEPWVS